MGFLMEGGLRLMADLRPLSGPRLSSSTNFFIEMLLLSGFIGVASLCGDRNLVAVEVICKGVALLLVR